MSCSTGSGKTTYDCTVCSKPVSAAKRCPHFKSCPSCGGFVLQYSPAIRDQPKDGNMAWLCLWCPAVICEWCFWQHTESNHPPQLSAPQPNP